MYQHQFQCPVAEDSTFFVTGQQTGLQNCKGMKLLIRVRRLKVRAKQGEMKQNKSVSMILSRVTKLSRAPCGLREITRENKLL